MDDNRMQLFPYFALMPCACAVLYVNYFQARLQNEASRTSQSLELAYHTQPVIIRGE